MSGLTDEQWELFYALQNAIVTRGQASEMLKKGWGDNPGGMLVLNASRHSSHTKIMIILIAAKEQNILKEVLTTSKDGFPPRLPWLYVLVIRK